MVSHWQVKKLMLVWLSLCLWLAYCCSSCPLWLGSGAWPSRGLARTKWLSSPLTSIMCPLNRVSLASRPACLSALLSVFLSSCLPSSLPAFLSACLPDWLPSYPCLPSVLSIHCQVKTSAKTYAEIEKDWKIILRDKPMRPWRPERPCL